MQTKFGAGSGEWIDGRLVVVRPVVMTLVAPGSEMTKSNVSAYKKMMAGAACTATMTKFTVQTNYIAQYQWLTETRAYLCPLSPNRLGSATFEENP